MTMSKEKGTRGELQVREYLRSKVNLQFERTPNSGATSTKAINFMECSTFPCSCGRRLPSWHPGWHGGWNQYLFLPEQECSFFRGRRWFRGKFNAGAARNSIRVTGKHGLDRHLSWLPEKLLQNPTIWCKSYAFFLQKPFFFFNMHPLLSPLETTDAKIRGNDPVTRYAGCKRVFL